MDARTTAMINGPITILNILANVFFGFCMMFPLPGERIKQPLKFLLGSMVCSILTFQMSVIVLYITNGNLKLSLVFGVPYMYSIYTSMTICVWLSFFFYTQLVPAQRALSIWIKKNIKPIIYSVWLFERVLGLNYITYLTGAYLTLSRPARQNYSNSTDVPLMYTPEHVSDSLRVVLITSALILGVQFCFSVCVMAMCNGSTVVYLSKHICHMQANGLSSQHLRSQVRVAVTGVLHGALFMFWSLWTFKHCYSSSMLYFLTYMSCTISNFYMAGTTVSLGVGQSVFRRRAAVVWITVVRWFKARKDQQTGEGGRPKLMP